MAKKTGIAGGQNARMMRIQQRLQARRGPEDRVTVASLAKELGMGERTIKRDLDYMVHTAGLPILYDKIEYTWKLTGAVSAFPMMTMSEGEVVAMVLAQAALHRYRGMPFEKQLGVALEKLEASLPAKMGVDMTEMAQAISFREASCPVLDLEVFEKLSAAVLKRRRVAFDYLKNGAPLAERRTVRPYHLTAVGLEWYLIAFDEERGALRHFRLSGMSEAATLTGSFEPPNGFDPTRHFASAFGLFVGETPSLVRIRFKGTAAKIVAKGVWHPSQTVKQEGGGALVLTMETGGLHEVAKWVMAFGDAAEVLEPPALRDIVVERCREIFTKYE